MALKINDTPSDDNKMDPPGDPDDEMINNLIRLRKLQQEALIKIMTSIEKSDEEPDSLSSRLNQVQLHAGTGKIVFSALRKLKK